MDELGKRNMPYKPRILIVDDEPDIGEFISDVAVDVGFDAVTIHTTEKFEEILSAGFDLLVLDLVMPGRDGVELLRTMAEQHTAVRIILISGFDSGVLHSAQKLALEHGLNVIATLNKPIIHEELEQLLANLAPSSEGFHSGGIELRELPGREELQKALTQGELELYYQPQLDITSGALAGVEALVRWNHPERGLLMPNIIIPLAEQAEMMDELTAEVIDQSFRQVSTWRRQGLHTQVSINIPADSLKELGFPELISNKIEHYQLQPEQVALEITETGLMQDLAKSLDVLTRLRIKGVKLSIDDFGTGYSSMVQLYRAPFSEIKIDQSFVMQATKDAEAQAIVDITILLGNRLGMTVVSEGIEDQETWDLLSGFGCDIAQGYFIARPMPGDQLLEWASGRKIPASINSSS